MSEDKVYFGTVIFFSKGFGFLDPDDQNAPDVFIHYSDISMDGFRTLKKGQRVFYSIGKNVRGQDKAINVKVLESTSSVEEK